MATPMPESQTITSRSASIGPLALVAFAATAVCIAAPVGYLIAGSFQAAAPGTPQNAFTLANCATVFGTTRYLSALLNTVLLSATVALLSVLLGGALAWIVARTDAPGRRALSVLLVVPLMISSLITALAWVALAAPN